MSATHTCDSTPDAGPRLYLAFELGWTLGRVAGPAAPQDGTVAPTLAAPVVDPSGHDGRGLAPAGRPTHIAKADHFQVIAVALAAAIERLVGCQRCDLRRRTLKLSGPARREKPLNDHKALQRTRHAAVRYATAPPTDMQPRVVVKMAASGPARHRLESVR
jgi:hypothetical protein